jgi:hypothetical protein
LGPWNARPAVRGGVKEWVRCSDSRDRRLAEFAPRVAAALALRVPFFFVLAALGALGCSCPELGWCAAAAPISRAALPPRPLVGDVSCQPNDTDCNICTPDVEAQFASPWRGKLAWWTFRSRPGLEVPPLAAYAALKGGHVQGFVRLNGPTEAYAMVHSVGIGGIASLSIVAPDADGLGLVNLYRLPARKGHTSGAFSLGKYVGLIDAPRTIALLDPFASFTSCSAAIRKRDSCRRRAIMA